MLILEAIDEMSNKIENQFISKYFEFLEFKKGYTNSSVISFCGRRGLRVDRVIVCEVLQSSKTLNQCL
jgi:hypothetical protein